MCSVCCAYVIRPNAHFWPIRLANCSPVKRSARGDYASVLEWMGVFMDVRTGLFTKCL